MASVAVAHHRYQHHSSKTIKCRAFHSFPSKSPPKKDSAFAESFSCSELWAGPAYTNSPPPSSLPIPKFSLPQKRCGSLEVPPVDSRSLIQPAPKSESRSSFTTDFFANPASATENLKRILNL